MRVREDPRLEALYSRSARDLIRLAQEHPESVEAAAAERPLPSRIGQGREEVERLLDEERRTLIRRNEDRLDRYVNAATPWGESLLHNIMFQKARTPSARRRAAVMHDRVRQVELTVRVHNDSSLDQETKDSFLELAAEEKADPRQS